MSILDKNWKYHNAAVTQRPGYLKRRFDKVRAEQKAKELADKAELDRIVARRVIRGKP